VEWVHDPRNLVPSLEEDPFLALAGPRDERQLDSRPDVLAFDSEPAEFPLDLAGPVTAVLDVSSSAASMHVIAVLLDVFPDGSAYRICDGASLVCEARRGARAIVSLAHTGYRLHPGHRLRLRVASSDFPHCLPHPGTEEDPWAATVVKANKQRLGVGGGHGSCLLLCVLSDRLSECGV
jgi:hypothetical protein